MMLPVATSATEEIWSLVGINQLLIFVDERSGPHLSNMQTENNAALL